MQDLTSSQRVPEVVQTPFWTAGCVNVVRDTKWYRGQSEKESRRKGSHIIRINRLELKYGEKPEILACGIPHRSFHGYTGDQGHAESTSGRDIGISVESGGGSRLRVVAALGYQ